MSEPQSIADIMRAHPWLLLPQWEQMITSDKSQSLSSVTEKLKRGWRKDIGIPERLLDATPETLSPQESDFCNLAIAEGGALITGPVGTGKSWMAATIFWRLMAPRLAVMYDKDLSADREHYVYRPESLQGPGLWLTVPEWFHKLRVAVALRKGFQDMLKAARDAYLVVLDDLGAEAVTSWTQDTLYLVVNHREENKMPMIATTNLTLNQLDSWNPRLMSRLARYPRFTTSGPDRRLVMP